MHGALVGDRKEARLLLVVEVAGDLDAAVDEVDPAGCGVGVGAVVGVGALVAEGDRDVVEREVLATAYIRRVIEVQAPSPASSSS